MHGHGNVQPAIDVGGLIIEQVGLGEQAPIGIVVDGAGRGHVDGQFFPNGEGGGQIAGIGAVQCFLHVNGHTSGQVQQDVIRNGAGQDPFFHIRPPPEGKTGQFACGDAIHQFLEFFIGQPRHQRQKHRIGVRRDLGQGIRTRVNRLDHRHLYGELGGQPPGHGVDLGDGLLQEIVDDDGHPVKGGDPPEQLKLPVNVGKGVDIVQVADAAGTLVGWDPLQFGIDHVGGEHRLAEAAAPADFMGGHLPDGQYHIHLIGRQQPIKGLVDLLDIPATAELGIGGEADLVGAAGHTSDLIGKEVSGSRKTFRITVINDTDANRFRLHQASEGQAQGDRC